MSLSSKDRLELTIFGYVRLNHEEEIPADITRICLDYYNAVEIIWDKFCDKVLDFVSDDGLDIKILKKRDSYSTFASSIGWDKGIHSFTVKQLDSKNYQFGVGVIESGGLYNVTSNKMEGYFLFYSGRTAYGFDGDGVSANDKITTVVDCNEWKLEFYINDKICKSHSSNMKKDKTYHPVITIWQRTTVSLRLIETSIDLENMVQRLK